jgi:hypothetical protein
LASSLALTGKQSPQVERPNGEPSGAVQLLLGANAHGNMWGPSGRVSTGNAYIDDYREFATTEFLWSPNHSVAWSYDEPNRVKGAHASAASWYA